MHTIAYWMAVQKLLVSRRTHEITQTHNSHRGLNGVMPRSGLKVDKPLWHCPREGSPIHLQPEIKVVRWGNMTDLSADNI